MAKGTCSIVGCERDAWMRSWCITHYSRWQRHGTPHYQPHKWASPDERFWAKVRKTETCWLWTGHLQRNGYALFSMPGGKRPMAHRWAYERVVGPIPTGLQLDHLCGVRNCVNPAHLEPVTALENTRRNDWSSKTHCINGHAKVPANDYFWRGTRYCRPCRLERHRRAA